MQGGDVGVCGRRPAWGASTIFNLTAFVFADLSRISVSGYLPPRCCIMDLAFITECPTLSGNFCLGCLRNVGILNNARALAVLQRYNLSWDEFIVGLDPL